MTAFYESARFTGFSIKTTPAGSLVAVFQHADASEPPSEYNAAALQNRIKQFKEIDVYPDVSVPALAAMQTRKTRLGIIALAFGTS